MRFSSLVVLGLVGLSATRTSAQTCAGAAAFSTGPMRVGAGLATSDGVKSYGVSAAMGAKAGPFATGNISRSVYSDVEDSGLLFGLGAGYAIDLGQTRTAQFCPRVVFDYQTGPDIDVGSTVVTTSGHAIGLGGSIGVTNRVSPTLDFVPFVGGSLVTSRSSVTVYGETQSASESYAALDGGVGFVLNKTLTVQPSASIPFGADNGKATFLLAFTFNFGAPKP